MFCKTEKKIIPRALLYLLLSVPFLLLKKKNFPKWWTDDLTGGHYKLVRQMFIVECKYFILKFHVILTIVTLLCTVLLARGELTAVLFGYAVDCRNSFSCKL